MPNDDFFSFDPEEENPRFTIGQLVRIRHDWHDQEVEFVGKIVGIEKDTFEVEDFDGRILYCDRTEMEMIDDE